MGTEMERRERDRTKRKEKTGSGQKGGMEEEAVKQRRIVRG